ncbi:MAG: aspartate-semialdehyde dehydrogenase, partial [Candidatus Methanomethylophilaceae archaeon]
MGKISVAVLGATGMIGQRFIQLLEDHPYFELGGLYASERSDGKKLSDVLKVRDHRFQDETLEMRIETLTNKAVANGNRIAFSGIPSEMAKETEAELADLGVAVFSNAGSHRMRPDVPLLIPEVNPEHIMAVRDQSTFPNGGFIVTNANCSTTGIAPPLKALDESYGLQFVSVSTYQALSGAGYPGVPSLDAVGNVIPYIGGEEEKMETEILKMLGEYQNGKFIYSQFTMLANCARVPVIDGHLESMVVKMREAPELD